jgi:hypothetical protein
MDIEAMNAIGGTFPTAVLDQLVDDLGETYSSNIVEFLGRHNMRMFVATAYEEANEEVDEEAESIPQEWRRESRIVALGAWRVTDGMPRAHVHAIERKQRCGAAAVEIQHRIRAEVLFWAQNLKMTTTIG